MSGPDPLDDAVLPGRAHRILSKASTFPELYYGWCVTTAGDRVCHCIVREVIGPSEALE